MKWIVPALLIGAAAAPADARDLVDIPGGVFVMGEASGEPDETPRRVMVEPFRIMRFEVTNRDFAAFVRATGYKTDAERTGAGYVWSGGWRMVRGADWRHPHGPASTIDHEGDNAVVQVSQRDAAAYCAWAGMRLPSEEEWEFAARGIEGRRYPWGDEAPVQSGTRRANFGTETCCAPDASDGEFKVGPVGHYPAGASPFGLMDMAGNVWEWTADPYRLRPGQVVMRGGGWGNNAYGLRASYRHGNPPDIGLDMAGFRCAADVS